MVSRVKSAFAGNNIKLEETMSNSETLKKLLKKSNESGGTKDEVKTIKTLQVKKIPDKSEFFLSIYSQIPSFVPGR